MGRASLAHLLCMAGFPLMQAFGKSVSPVGICQPASLGSVDGWLVASTFREIFGGRPCSVAAFGRDRKWVPSTWKAHAAVHGSGFVLPYVWCGRLFGKLSGGNWMVVGERCHGVVLLLATEHAFVFLPCNSSSVSYVRRLYDCLWRHRDRR
jgi:hypothetical protein